MRRLVLALMTLACVLFVVRGEAHETRAARIDVVVISPTEARITVRPPLSIAEPPGCRMRAGVLSCTDGIAGKTFDVEGLGEGVDVAYVRIEGETDEGTVATKRAPHVTMPGAPATESVALRFVRLGAEHVLSGADHILFLIALFFQARLRGRGRALIAELARTATAFTLAHSLTLTTTVLGLVRIPPLAAEAAIAWSLVLIALDLGRQTNERPYARAGLAGAFGLVHGLGFASALAETGLPEHARAVALVSFNVGVECGQLVALVACGVVLAVLGRSFTDRSTNVAAYAVGSVGAAMFFLRLSALLSG